MILDELLWVINDNVVVKIFSSDGNEIACYDGKDSIPDELNELDVNDVFVENNCLCVEINEEDKDEDC